MKTVLITGASSGIGLALVHFYLTQQYHVIACGRNQDKLSSLFAHIDHVTTLVFDVTCTESIQKAANTISSPIDIMILNAGDCGYIDDVNQFDATLFEHIIQVNLISLGYIISHFLGKLSRGSQLAFISSIATTLPFPRTHAYGASKAGVDYLANTLRCDLHEQGIDVTLIHPGFIKTPLTDKNDFTMPCLMTSEQAAKRIFHGIEQRKAYFSFPKRFTYPLKLMRLLPTVLWRKYVF